MSDTRRELMVSSQAALEGLYRYFELVAVDADRLYWAGDFGTDEEYAKFFGWTQLCYEHLVELIQGNKDIPPAILIEHEIDKADKSAINAPTGSVFGEFFSFVKSQMEDIYDYVIIN